MDDVKLSDGISGIVNGQYYKDKGSRIGNKKFSNSDIKLNKLVWLNPVKYRDYPKFDKPFRFNRINLIDGANGHGKTSLLEAIELLITGENHRIGEGDNNYHIEAKFDGDEVSRRFKKDMQLFRERDRIWYNGMDKLRGSDLSANFNKFNFYNTDAAFRLTITKNEREIEEAFRDIALGDEVNFLRKQISSYQSRLQSESKTRQATIDRYDEDILKAQLLLTELRKTDGKESVLITSLYDRIKSQGLTIDMLGADLVSLDRLKFQITALLSEIDDIDKRISWIDKANLSKLREEQAILRQLTDKIDVHHESKMQFVKDINNTNSQNEWLSESRKVLMELDTYFKNDAYAQLDGLAEKLRIQEYKTNNLKAVNNMYLPLKAFTFTNVEKRLDDLIADNLESFQKDSKALEQIELELEKSKRNISQFKALIETIKSHGRNFIELAPESKVCPLCENQFATADHLHSSILHKIEDNINNENFSGLLTIKAQLEKSTSFTNELINSVNLVITLAAQLGVKFNKSEANLSYLMRQIELMLSTLQEEDSLLTSLNIFSKKCKSLDLSEMNLTKLKSRFAELFPSAQLSQDFISKHIELLLKAYDLNSEKAAELIKVMTGKDSELLAEIRFYDPYFSLTNTDEIKKRFVVVQHFLRSLGDTIDITFDDDRLFSNLQFELKSLIEQLDEIRSDLSVKQKESGISAKTNETIDGLVKERLTAVAQQSRLDKALDALNSMLTEYSEDAFLDAFLDNNKQEIKDTFLAIHTPREFADISIKEGKIQLFKKNGQTTNLMRISTGQRSALALSLFLTLNNKLKNGPEVIIFDDPVTFTDDLNILSFLDYLRELVISRNKQLFFATANENLSFLFQKKFQILSDDFNHISLERSE